MDIRQPVITARVSVGQLFVIQTHQVQNRGMKVMHVNGVFSDVDAVFV